MIKLKFLVLLFVFISLNAIGQNQEIKLETESIVIEDVGGLRVYNHKGEVVDKIPMYGHWSILDSEDDTLAFGYFQNGKLRGSITTFFESGLIKCSYLLENGRIESKICYYDSGKIAIRCHRNSHDASEFICNSFSSDGELGIVLIYHDGEPVMETTYNSKGKWYKKTYFENGNFTHSRTRKRRAY